jgi:hypothetical protein
MTEDGRKKMSRLTAAFSVILLVFVALFIVGSIMALPLPWNATASPCELHATAAIVTRDTPIGRASNWDSDLLIIRNVNAAEWDNLEVTIYGFETNGVTGRTPTGPYKFKKDGDTTGLQTVDLKNFQKPDGARWISLTMRVEEVVMKASVNGQVCSAEIRPTFVSDVIRQ